MDLLLINGKIVMEEGILSEHVLLIRNKKIEAILPANEIDQETLSNNQNIDLQGGYICPGWIDLHIHGAVGADVMDGTAESILKIARFKATQGVTGFIPTGITNHYAAIEQAALAVKEAVEANDEGAKILGFHLEGPFISPVQKGIHRVELIQAVDIDWTLKIKELIPGKLLVTVAPETEGGMAYIREITSNGAIVGIGHSNGTYAEIKAAYEAGASYGVHLFNGMLGMHHREPGVVGAILDLPLFTELILDGIHVHPVMAKMVTKLKLPDQLILVTDAMRAAGLEDGEYSIGGMQVKKTGKAVRSADGTLAGSTLTMQAAVQNAANLIGLTIVEIVKMVATNPAVLLGIIDRKGTITVGKDADLTLLTPDLHVRETIISGKVVYERLE